MDLKQQIDQLNEVINTYEANIETLKEKLKDARIKRRKFLLLEEKAKEIINESEAPNREANESSEAYTDRLKKLGFAGKQTIS
jgi:hypothetical protein